MIPKFLKGDPGICNYTVHGQGHGCLALRLAWPSEGQGQARILVGWPGPLTVKAKAPDLAQPWPDLDLPGLALSESRTSLTASRE